METANDISYLMIDDNYGHFDDVDIIDVPVDDTIVGGLGDETREKGEKGEKHEKVNDNSKLEIKTQFKEIEMSINTSTCDEVIFKKHVVEIIDKGTRGCVMDGVVVRYEFEGRVWDPDIVLVFEDGRRFCNENFGYMFRFYL